MDFKEVLKEKRDAVYNEIYTYLEPLEGPGNMREVVFEYPKRQGKALRPTLLLLACEAFGGDPKKAMKTAAAMQTSEDWILIHDDWQDDSDERRGKPTLHKMYGNEIAVNAGDYLHVIMHKMLRDNEKAIGADKTFKIMDHMYHILEKTIEGQHLEITETNKRSPDFAEHIPYDIMYTKTCFYTIVGPMQLGALVAGADARLVQEIHDAARSLGIGFQIQDDLLNIGGSQEKYGKEIGGDILEGKLTVLLWYLMQRATDEEKNKIRAIWKKPRLQKTEAEKDYVLGLMRKYDCVGYAAKLAKQQGMEARERFAKLLARYPKNAAHEKLLSGFDFVVNRDI